jgi:glycosyltransferase involved in cell wall biosynthesis
MPFLLNSVDCLLFPSLYEGFGMPVIEALACGTPVVCSNRGALPEVAKGMASIHDARDVDGMADSVCDILYTAQRRNAGGLHDEVCNRFSWREAARRTYEEYHRAGGSA